MSDGQQSPDELRELLRQVGRLEVRTEAWVDSLAAGQYRSRFKGQGMEFEDVREYAEGDDVRHIDWNVSARAGRPYVKTFREERDLTIMLLVDVSGSMRFGAVPGLSPRTKLVTAAQAAAIVGVTAMRNADFIGLITFDQQCRTHLRPRKGRTHAMRVIRECLAVGEQWQPTSVADALQEFLQVCRKRTVCFLISDFLHYEPRLGSLLARAARRHDLIGLRVADPAEASLPASLLPLSLHDPESGAERLVASSRANRQQYAERYRLLREQTDSVFANAGCQLVDLATDASAFTAIRRCFERRRQRRRPA